MKTIEVVAAIIEKDNKFLATERGYGDFKGFYEFPGGKIEPKESKEEALRREIKEELNADIEIKNFLLTVEYDYSDFHLTMHCFICELRDNFRLLEHTNAKWLTKDTFNSVTWCPADIEVTEKLKIYSPNK